MQLGSDASRQLQNIIVNRAASSSSDKEALTYISEIELKQDVKDPRPYELVFVSCASHRVAPSSSWDRFTPLHLPTGGPHARCMCGHCGLDWTGFSADGRLALP